MFKVSQRSSKKGPGKLVTVVATKPEAEEIKQMLDSEKSGIETFVSDFLDVVVETPQSFATRRQAELQVRETKAAALNKLSAEERSALGF
jgi:hypothetical protein